MRFHLSAVDADVWALCVWIKRLKTGVSPRSGPRGRREACGGGTSTGPEPAPGRGRREGAGSTPARSAWTGLEGEAGFSLRKRDVSSKPALRHDRC